MNHVLTDQFKAGVWSFVSLNALARLACVCARILYIRTVLSSHGRHYFIFLYSISLVFRKLKEKNKRREFFLSFHTQFDGDAYLEYHGSWSWQTGR
jgi:hypothetical protein